MEKKNRDELLATECRVSQNERFKVQINNFDSYMTLPTVFDRPGPPGKTADGFTYHNVPVMRVFGSLPTGHNILVHIHGVFPYLYVPFDNQNCFEFQKRIEKAVKLSLQRNKESSEEKDVDLKEFKYVAHVETCKGVPFYGFHVGFQGFHKINLLNPSYLGRVADLLRDGKVNGKRYDIFESHVPLSLQFLTDFNLFGCGWLRIGNAFIRLPILYDESVKTDELVEYLTGYNTTTVDRVGTSALEIDVLAQDILNRGDLSERNLHHDFVEKFNPLKSDIYIQSTRDLWRDGDFQRRIKGMPSYSAIQSTLRNIDEKWVDSEENESMFEYVKQMNPGPDPDHLEFGSYLKPNFVVDDLPTSFQAFSSMFYEPEFENDLDLDESTNYDENLEEVEDHTEEEEEDLNDYLLKNNDHANFINHQDDAIDDVDLDAGDVQEEVHAFPSTGSSNNDNNDYSETKLTEQIPEVFTFKRKVAQISSSNITNTKIKVPKFDESNERYVYSPPPLNINFEEYGLPTVQYDDPFYMEAPPNPFIFAGKRFKLDSKLPEYLKAGDIRGESIVSEPLGTLAKESKSSRWRYIKEPPPFKEVEIATTQHDPLTQVGVSHRYKFGTQHTLERRPDGFNSLRVMIMELFVPTRGKLKSDPNFDGIGALFWKSVNGDETEEGMFVVNPKQTVPHVKTRSFDTELSMIESFLSFVSSYDPDVISGYEVHASSWGYLIDRCKAKYEIEVLMQLSRVRIKGHNKMGDHWGYTHTSSIKICGRHVLNIWRPLRELKLGRTTVEHVAYHLLHERIPHFSELSLTNLYKTDFCGLVKYFTNRVEIDHKLIESGDLIVRAAEEARLIGVDFYDVYYRGSQYKVESLMVRIAKSENFMLLSPSKKQVRDQKPLECIPLVMEPISAYYKSPLVVLDFQSLYPSIMIAYNYCYSTLLGRLRNYSIGLNPIGVGKVKHPPGLLKLLENDINLSPNGLMFVKSTVRKSLLAKMLEDLLDTRFMVKSTMRFLEPNLKRLYNNRQLALKLTANVVYGYSSASFSGRMPCSDIADAIVQTGRETLEKAISLIENEPEWGAKVVYGDTDSLFVYLPGRSREDSFRIGKQMADRVTKCNPDPVTLKFEKVYHPSVLMAKKRYVGYSYESIDSAPKFDAKGIETVRRDGHPAQQHIVEQCLRTLFETNNITEIKSYVQDQFNKIIFNDVSIQDFCFAKDVKIGTYKNPPPGAIVSERKMAEDSRAEPQFRERVPYVIIEDPGKILRDRARSPEDFIKNNNKLDSEYYVVKTLIPPLERIFNLIGVNVRQWYADMPKRVKKSKIYSKYCLSCGISSRNRLCDDCKSHELKTLLNFKQRMKDQEIRLKDILQTCRSCADNSTLCESHDCPVYFAKVRESKKLRELEADQEVLRTYIDW